MDQKACVMVHHLERDSSGVAADHRLAFPQTLGNGKTEPFLKRLLDYEGCSSLEGVDGEVCIGIQKQDMDVRVAVGRSLTSASTSAPSGSSVAVPPASTSCTGMWDRTIR